MPMITDFNSAVRHAGYALSERERNIAMCFWNLARGFEIGDGLSGGPVLPFDQAVPILYACLSPEQGNIKKMAADLIYAYLSSGASREGSSSPGSSDDSGLVSMSKTGRDGLCDQCPFRLPCEPCPTLSPSGEPHCGSPGASSALPSNCIDAGE